MAVGGWIMPPVVGIGSAATLAGRGGWCAAAAAASGPLAGTSQGGVKLLGPYSLRLELLRPHSQLPPTVAIPGVHPLDVQKLSGFISVATEPGVAAKTTNFDGLTEIDRKSTRLNSSHLGISYAVFCLKK